jgi:hypothetical protein
MSLDNYTALVGSYGGDDGGGLQAGVAYVFLQSNTTWSVLAAHKRAHIIIFRCPTRTPFPVLSQTSTRFVCCTSKLLHRYGLRPLRVRTRLLRARLETRGVVCQESAG